MIIYYTEQVIELRFLDLDIAELEEFSDIKDAINANTNRSDLAEILDVEQFAIEEPLFEEFDRNYAAQENIDLDKLVYEKYVDNRKLDEERMQF